MFSFKKQRWMVRYDNEAQDVEATSRSIKLVPVTSGLSPGSKARVVSESNGEGDDGDDDSSSDKDDSESSSEEEQQDAALVEGTNIHATRSAAFDAKMAKLYGSTIEVKSVMPSLLLLPNCSFFLRPRTGTRRPRGQSLNKPVKLTLFLSYLVHWAARGRQLRSTSYVRSSFSER